MSPFDNCDLFTVVSKDTIGTNTGNMLFPFSIMREIYSEDTEIDSYNLINPDDADKINETYDMFIIPLANAFRETFNLESLTKLIKKLKIPCIVVGVGLQTSYEPDFSVSFPFDKQVYSFVSAILEKSVYIGVRGEITARYLRKLGFSADKIWVIGCPSMFMYGSFLPMKRPYALSNKSTITISYHGNFTNYYEFLERCKRTYQYYIIPQGIRDLRLLYAGDKISDEFMPNQYYIKDIDYYSYMNNRIRMFINVPSWINFLSKADVGIGSCIHGSIASILAGNPTLIFAADSRVRELAEYHNLVSIKITDIDNNTTLEDLYDRCDFSQIQDGHEKRYMTYVSFLKKNGIQTHDIRQEGGYAFDKVLQNMSLHCPEGVGCYTALPYEQQLEQLTNYLNLVKGKIKWWKTQNKDKNIVARGIKPWEISKICIENRISKLK